MCTEIKSVFGRAMTTAGNQKRINREISKIRMSSSDRMTTRYYRYCINRLLSVGVCVCASMGKECSAREVACDRALEPSAKLELWNCIAWCR